MGLVLLQRSQMVHSAFRQGDAVLGELAERKRPTIWDGCSWMIRWSRRHWLFPAFRLWVERNLATYSVDDVGGRRRFGAINGRGSWSLESVECRASWAECVLFHRSRCYCRRGRRAVIAATNAVADLVVETIGVAAVESRRSADARCRGREKRLSIKVACSVDPTEGFTNPVASGKRPVLVKVDVCFLNKGIPLESIKRVGTIHCLFII
jgi:hypothetical protein